MTKALAWFGFSVGCAVALVFFLWPFSLFAQGCFVCFGFDFDLKRGYVLAFAAMFAVMNGSLYGLVGIAIGYIISRSKTAVDRKSDKSV